MGSQTTILSNIGSIGMNNTSAAAVTVQMAQGIGLAIDNTILEFADTQTLILQTITNKNYGKPGWYVAKALAFQNGYNLTVDPITLADVYAVIDPTAQIIKQAAFEVLTQGNDIQLFLKIAGQNSSTGLLQPLTATQFAAFQSYMTNFLIPYIPVSFINAQPDVLNFNALCTYLPTYDFTALQTAIAAQLQLLLTVFQFDGIFFSGDLEDFMKYGNIPQGGTIPGVPGMRNFRLSNTSINGVAFDGTTPLPAGYFNYLSTILNNISYAVAA